MKPSILILHASGTNRDEEAARACQLAGGQPEIVHGNQLRASNRTWSDYQMLLLPGGFSYGDALGAGQRIALDMQVYFQAELTAFIESGKPVLGICNGFQALVKAGFLPGQPNASNNNHNGARPARQVTLTDNQNGHFECRWVHLQVNNTAAAAHLRPIDQLIFCPVAHGEGNFQVTDQAALAELEANNLIAFRYVNPDGTPANRVYPTNPNGSIADIAGICNEQGNVVGLMPHPEDHIVPIQNPLPRAVRPELQAESQLGLQLFTAMIERANA